MARIEHGNIFVSKTRTEDGLDPAKQYQSAPVGSRSTSQNVNIACDSGYGHVTDCGDTYDHHHHHHHRHGTGVLLPTYNQSRPITSYWGVFMGEMLVSFFVYLGAYMVAAAGGTSLEISLAQGFVLAAALSIAISQGAFGHINPATTLTFFILESLGYQIFVFNKWLALGLYIAAQTVGALLAIAVVYGVIGLTGTNFGAPILSVSVGSGFLFESVGSFIIHLAILFMIIGIVQGHNPKQMRLAGTVNHALVIGFLQFVFDASGVYITGGAFNWYRQFWPALLSGSLIMEHWIYGVGSLVGALVATLTFYIIGWTKQY